jgi:hypothetical protein
VVESLEGQMSETITVEDVLRIYTMFTPTRLLADGRQLWLYPMIFTDRLAIGRAGADGYDDFWCYENREAGMRAFLDWDPLDPRTPEPDGWIKHKRTGRFRPGGDPALERIG